MKAQQARAAVFRGYSNPYAEKKIQEHQNKVNRDLEKLDALMLDQASDCSEEQNKTKK